MSIDTKTKLDWLRTAVGAAFVVGTLWATTNNRLTAVEKGLDTKASKTDLAYITSQLKSMDTEISKQPGKSEFNMVQGSLTRIERQLNDALPRLRSMEQDMAVLKSDRNRRYSPDE